MSPQPAPDTTVGFVVSEDGTRIGYRRMGRGPGLVLVHGGLQSGWSLLELGAALSDVFTVHIPDRRGRGLSADGALGLAGEVADLHALLDATGATGVFGLSAGGLVTLATASVRPDQRRIAVYEPPLKLDGSDAPWAWTSTYARAMARDDLAGALTAILKGTGDRALMTSLPALLLRALFAPGLRREAERGPEEEPSLRALIPTMRRDIALIAAMAGRLESFRDLPTETLLMAGTISADYLIGATDALAGVLPRGRRVTLPGLGHIAAANGEQPEQVAAALKAWFA
jgi:pimeloyl-ACP methyl ester carboxylesterase